MSSVPAVIEHEDEPKQGGFLNLFGGASPVEVVSRTAQVADALAAVVNKKHLFAIIQGKKYPTVEAWTLLGSMLGVYPVCVWTKELSDGAGWEARVEARTRDGAVIGAAEAECRITEKTWSKRDSYALRGMAQTRATSRALRQPLGFVLKLAGLEATAAEEMPSS